MKKLQDLDEENTLQLIHVCKNDQLYKSLYVIIKTKKYDALQVGINWKVLEKKLSHLAKNENFEFAEDLLSCARLLFKEREGEINNWQQILAKNKSIQQVPERSRFEGMDALKEFFKYYVHVILIKNHSIAKIPEDIFSNACAEINNLFTKIKEYVLTAVLSEVRHEENSSNSSWFNNPSIYFSYTEEEMRIFFEKTAKKFGNKGFFPKGSGYGGDSWAFIAELGELFWRNQSQLELSQKIALINIAIGTQHNNNFFFDKDGIRVKLNSNKLSEFLNFEAAGKHTLESLIEYGYSNQIITIQEANYYIGLQENFLKNIQDSAGQLSLDKIYLKIADMKTQKAIQRIIENQSIPREIKAYVQSVYSKTYGFKRISTGYEYLGRLLKTTNIRWTKDDENIKYYKRNEHEIYYLDIEGYNLAFWYVNGALKDIKDVRALHENRLQISEATETVIVRAMLGTVREGD